MALVLNDRVKETSTTTGQGTLDLAGAATGFETFVTGIGDGNTTYYGIVHATDGTWEIGIGTVTDASTDTLARTTVIDTSSGNTTKINFATGTKNVFCTLPSSKAVFLDADGDVTLGANLDIGGNLVVTGTTTFNGGTLTLGDANTDNIVFGGEVDSNIIPDDDNTYDLGSSSKEWKDIYIDGTAYLDAINFDGTAISATAAELNILDGVTASATDINLIDGITNGTVIASKAIITDSNKDITGGRNITISGELDAATLDISGNADIDGTLEADAITVDGVTLATFVRDTVGNNMVSSNTESGITVTYDTTNDNIDFSVDAAQTGITSLLATDIKIGEDDQTKIDFETADEIHFYAANVEQVYLGDNIFGPQSDSDVDLGSTGVRWKDAFVDSLTATGDLTIGGNFTVNGTTTTVATTNMVVSDNLIELNNGASSNSNDSGIVIERGSTGDNAIFMWDESNDTFVLGTTTATGSSTGNLTVTDGALQAGSLDISGNVDIDGTLETDALSIASTAVTSTAAELNLLDGITAGTVSASLAVIVDSNKDITGFRNITLTGELDAATLDISGNADIDGTLEADAITIGGVSTDTLYASPGFAVAMAIAL